MDKEEIIQNALAFLNEIGQANAFDEFLNDKGYTQEETEKMWNDHG